MSILLHVLISGVYHSAKIRNFKQITTEVPYLLSSVEVFITLQRYEILSKSQPEQTTTYPFIGVYHSAKIRNFKQITTVALVEPLVVWCLSLCKDTKF